VQKLLGHSNPKITAETYAHLALDYLLAEVNLLRFGVDHLAPVAKASQRVAAASTIRVTPELQSASPLEGEAGAPSLLPEGIPASEMAGCTGLEPVLTERSLTGVSGVFVDLPLKKRTPGRASTGLFRSTGGRLQQIPADCMDSFGPWRPRR